MRRLHLIMAALMLACLAAPAAAQQGRATGSVVDASGRPIKGATIRASNREAYPPLLTAATDDKGRWAIIGLRGGVWTFRAEAPGYLPSEGTVPIRVGTPGPPMRFGLQRSPEPIPGALSKDIDSELGAAQALRNEGRYDQALSAYQSIQTKHPKLTALNLVIGGVYRQQAEREQDTTARQALYGRAIASYGELIKADTGNDRAKLELGLTQRTTGQTDAATRTFQDIIAAAPNSAAAAEATAYLQEMKK